VTPTFIFKSLHGEGLPLENNGIATRDFIYVDDIVEGLILCAINGTPGGVYNIASGQETSIADLAAMINQITGNSASIDFQPARNWDRSGKRYAATDKSKQELGFSAKVDIQEGLEKTIQWTQANLSTIKACMNKHLRYIPELKSYLTTPQEVALMGD
jgi:nucleoside-diphosphate-sugar epimerase